METRERQTFEQNHNLLFTMKTLLSWSTSRATLLRSCLVSYFWLSALCSSGNITKVGMKSTLLQHKHPHRNQERRRQIITLVFRSRKRLQAGGKKENIKYFFIFYSCFYFFFSLCSLYEQLLFMSNFAWQSLHNYLQKKGKHSGC